jgi:hypothetical protein
LRTPKQQDVEIMRRQSVKLEDVKCWTLYHFCHMLAVGNVLCSQIEKAKLLQGKQQSIL